MENEVTKKVKNSNNTAKNKSSSKKTTTGTKKKSTTNKSKSSSVNKKSTPKNNTSSKSTKKSTTKKTTTTVNNTIKKDSASTVKKTNTSTTPKKNNKKKSNTKKNNTYQYNKRNLDKNKKVEVKSDELVDESIHVDKVVTQEKFIFEDEKNNETIESILEGIDLNKNISKEEELEYTGLISVVDENTEVEDSNEVPEEFEKEIIEDILGEKDKEDEIVETTLVEPIEEEILESTHEESHEITTDEVKDEVEILDVSTTEVDGSIIEVEFDKESTNDIDEILDEVLTDEEKVSIREEEILEDILEDKEKKEEFYPFDEEDIELDSEIRREDIETLEEEDSLFKTLRVDLYDIYDRDNDFDEEIVSTKTVENVDDKFLLVDNILTDESRNNIIPDNVFVKEDEDEYYNVVLWDSIIGVLLVIFTILAIFAIWFMVYLTTY